MREPFPAGVGCRVQRGSWTLLPEVSGVVVELEPDMLEPLLAPDDVEPLFFFCLWVLDLSVVVAEVSDPYRLAPEALVSLPDELDGADMVESESLVLGRDDVLDEGDWVEP